MSACVFIILHTCLAGVIYQDDLFEQDSGRCVKDAVDCPQEGGPGLIVKDNNDTGGRQRGTATKLPLNTPEEHKALTYEMNPKVAEPLVDREHTLCKIPPEQRDYRACDMHRCHSAGLRHTPREH